ncbi:DEAD/DEAH box helicase [Allofournierella sp.]|uniref:DEAD/DEAH box helicase n=1 Tax=Allofournierella sp. TaxID=1940256 RepID=UPI003AF43004
MIMTLDGACRLADVPQLLFEQLTRELTVPNPDYQTALRLGRPTYGIKKHLMLYRVENNELVLPRGMAMRVWARRPKGAESHDRTQTCRPVDFPRSTIALRDYQAQATATVLQSKIPQGIITMPCGAGKTETGLYILAQLRQPALWITHTKDLVEQTAQRARERLGLQGAELGIIGAGERQVGTHLTVATVQTLYRMELDDIAHLFGAVIVDECHRVVHNPEKASMFAAVLEQLPAKYRYGLTASEHRSDGLEDTIYQVLGAKITGVDQAVLDAAGNVVTPAVQPVYTDFTYTPAPREDRIDAQRLLRHMCSDDDRVVLIYSHLENEILNGHACLVLAQNLALLEQLHEMAQRAGHPTAFISGASKRTERAAAIAGMKAGTLRCLFATYQLAKEGLDIPRADRLLLASPVRDSVIVQQSVGRIMRPAEGKMDALVYDFVDKAVPTCKSQYNARRRVYKQLHCVIKNEKEKEQ